jgi:nicotinate-nucleotide pyrophosphorylase (carboxylating)
MRDIRDDIFRRVAERRIRAAIIADDPGILAETGAAAEAARNGTGIVFIDSGRIGDLERVNEALQQTGLRDRVEIAFGGNVRLENVDALKTMDVDILDIGRAIVDAPLLDMRMDVIEV